MTSVDVRHAAHPDLPHLASALARASSLPHGHVYTTDGWAGAALWNPPGTWQTSLLGQFRLFLPLAGLLGTRLPTLAREGVPAYLESSKERNIPFYARHGFEVTSQMDLPGGPPMWPMWRDPR